MLLAHSSVVAASAVPPTAPCARDSIVGPAQAPYIVSYTTYFRVSSLPWKYSQMTCSSPYRHPVAARAVPFRTTLADVSVPLAVHVLPDPDEDVPESVSALVEPALPSVFAEVPLRRFSVTCHPTIPPITPETIAISMALPMSMILVFPFALL